MVSLVFDLLGFSKPHADCAVPPFGWRDRRSERMHVTRDFADARSEEHTSELQSLMRISYAVFCLKKKKTGITKYFKISKRTNLKTNRIITRTYTYTHMKYSTDATT